MKRSNGVHAVRSIGCHVEHDCSNCCSVLVVLCLPLSRVSVCVCLHHADVFRAYDGAL